MPLHFILSKMDIVSSQTKFILILELVSLTLRGAEL